MKNWLYRFFSGRHGHDSLNYFLMVLSIVLLVFNMIFRTTLFYYFSLFLWACSLFRMMSRNIYQRRMENSWFLAKTKRIRHYFMSFKRNSKDTTHKTFVCPKCAQLVRVPKGKGVITITCPKCYHKFDKKS